MRILGWLHIVLGFIDLAIGLMAFGVLSGVGILSGDVRMFTALSVIGTFTAGVMLIMALPNFVCGLGLLRNWGGWVIIVAVILGLVNLTNMPVGTAIAIYTFWIAWRLYNASESRAV